MQKLNKMKNIAVNYTVYQKLKDLGRAGDSFNDVLIKILSQEQLQKEKEEEEKKTICYNLSIESQPCPKL